MSSMLGDYQLNIVQGRETAIALGIHNRVVRGTSDKRWTADIGNELCGTRSRVVRGQQTAPIVCAQPLVKNGNGLNAGGVKALWEAITLMNPSAFLLTLSAGSSFVLRGRSSTLRGCGSRGSAPASRRRRYRCRADWPHSASGSSRSPRHSSPWQAMARRVGEFSPTRSVKARTSTPPMLTAMAPTAARTRSANISTARRARQLPCSAASSISAKSDDTPETPSRPEPWFRAASRSSARQAMAALDVGQDARIEGAGPRSHHQAVQGAEAHGHGDGGIAADGRRRAAAAEVAVDDPQPGRIATEDLGRPTGTVSVADAVKTEAADAPIGIPGVGQGIDVRPGRKLREEGRIEDRHLPRLRQCGLRRGDGRQGRRIVQRGQVGPAGDALPHGAVDQHAFAKSRPRRERRGVLRPGYPPATAVPSGPASAKA